MSTKQDVSEDDFEVKGKYANYLKVGFNAFEFILDFSQYFPENKKLHLFTRIITNPMYAKAFSDVLQESVRQYETAHGAIPDGNDDKENSK